MLLWSGAWRGAPDGVATLKVSKGAFDALNRGSGALGKVKCKVVASSGAPPEELYSGVNKSARERIGRQNLSQKVPSKKGSLGVIFSPRNYRENAHSKSANFEGRHSGGHLLGRPLLFTSDLWSWAIYHARGNKYISNPQPCFNVYVFVLNSNLLTKKIVQVCVLVSFIREIPEKGASYVYLIQIQRCSQFFTYVFVYWIHNSGPKTKECACVFFGWDGKLQYV